MERVHFFCSVRSYALFLWEAGIIQIRQEPPWFEWSSGLLSPLYVDHRRLLAFPEWRRWVVRHFVERLRIASIPFQGVAGVATGGIPWAAWIGEELGLPVGYVRSQPKTHGTKRSVEGFVKPIPVLLIEDLISTGESIHRAAMTLEKEGFPVAALGALWSYDFPSLASLKYPVHALLTFPRALLYWESAGLISPADKAMLLGWHRSFRLPPPKEKSPIK